MLKPLDQRWLRALAAPHGTLSRGMLGRVLLFGLIAAFVTVTRRAGYGINVPIGFHEVAGAIVALTLAFRTNTAHLRFWEGRTLWGYIVNASRSLARIVGEHATIPPDAVRTFEAWIVVFAHATRRSLRDQKQLAEIERLLPPDDFAELARAHHPALYAAGQLSRTLSTLRREGKMTDILVAQAEGQVVALVDAMGGCERIKATPTPVSYVLLVRRTIVIFLATLPFALVDSLGDLEIMVTMLVAYPTLLIEAIANELDNPFDHDPNDLPLSRICAKIEMDLLGTEPPPSGVAPYLLD